MAPPETRQLLLRREAQLEFPLLKRIRGDFGSTRCRCRRTPGTAPSLRVSSGASPTTSVSSKESLGACAPATIGASRSPESGGLSQGCASTPQTVFFFFFGVYISQRLERRTSVFGSAENVRIVILRLCVAFTRSASKIGESTHEEVLSGRGGRFPRIRTSNRAVSEGERCWEPLGSQKASAIKGRGGLGQHQSVMRASLAKVFRRDSSSEICSRESTPEVDDLRRRRSGFFGRLSFGRTSGRRFGGASRSDSESEGQQKVDLLLTEIKMLENATQRYCQQTKEEAERRIRAEQELARVRSGVARVVAEHQELIRQVRILRMMVEFDGRKRELFERKKATLRNFPSRREPRGTFAPT
ncbi:hypothetical protein QR680_009525 [Steinernema hermaphroditum]|uniref:Uncharacterized protein n=1 Tax=Steinernema hermaphroditum TaxID=289476 RepID=A0AA39IKL4_9BILA|nr:hypothetical protein QR680_009525 [Steinernema hermaphroditum]